MASRAPRNRFVELRGHKVLQKLCLAKTVSCKNCWHSTPLNIGKMVEDLYPTPTMGMNIKDPQAHSMARELAALTGQSLTDAVKMALQQALVGLKANQTASKSRPLSERLNEIAVRCAALPDYDDRSSNDILSYDENGLPR